MSEYQLNWTSFKNNLCKGFSQLQQKEEFVDMTLAADGHLVRVHRNIMSVASPYIKEMLQSTTCRDPIVFLNNMSSHVLCYILEYIYTGEVKVPKHILNTFIKAAKSLHITGIKDLVTPMISEDLSQPSSENFSKRCGRLIESIAAIKQQNYIQSDADRNIDKSSKENEENQSLANNKNTFTLQDLDPQRHSFPNNVNSNNINDMNIDLMDVDVAQRQYIKGYPQNFNSQTPQEKSLLDKAMENIEIINEDDQYKASITMNFADDGGVRLENNGESSVPKFDIQIQSCQRNPENEYPAMPAISINVNKNMQRPECVDSLAKENTDGEAHDASAPLYSISSRGYLQLILNRFIYNVHHSSHLHNKRRWRCIDYRKLNCKAYIDTLSDEIVERKNEHVHGFHDTKILKKGAQQNIYSTPEGAEAAAQAEVGFQSGT